MDKKQARMRRAARARAKIRELGVYRLCVFRSPRHIYAQVIDPDGGRVVASASTLDNEYKEYRRSNTGAGHAGNAAAAAVVGQAIAERAKSAGIERVAFDRSGFRYHGRVKVLAEAAREHGLQF